MQFSLYLLDTWGRKVGDFAFSTTQNSDFFIFQMFKFGFLCIIDRMFKFVSKRKNTP